MRVTLIVLCVAQLMIAQTPLKPETVAANASISGVVKDKTTGSPLKGYTVSTYTNATWSDGGITMTQATKQITSVTDDSGRYRLGDLPAAEYQVIAQPAQGGAAGRQMRVVRIAGNDLQGIDFSAVASGVITGKVIDENKDPVPNMSVSLVAKEYYLGTVGYYFKGYAQTNDLGEYTVSGVEPGRTYYLMTEMNRNRLPAHAETPLSSKMRRRVPMRTWFPSSPDKEGAAAVSLRPGERREGVNVEVRKSPSYCMAGTVMTPNGPAALNVGIELLGPSSGVSNSGGSFRGTPTAVTAQDGEFRICDLAPGNYRVTVSERNMTPDSQFAIGVVTIADQDLSGLRFPTSSRLSINAEAALEGTVPQTPISVKASVLLRALFRTQLPGEKSNGRVDIPGTAELSGLLYDDYGVRVTVGSPGLYVKDVTYAGRSVMYEPLRLGSAAAGSGLRVTIGQDGGTVSATVTDKDSNPVSSSTVIVIPAGTPSEAVLAARIVSGQTNQLGQFKSGTLAPGKYFVVATEDFYDMTPESIGKLWQSHARYQEVELNPGGTVQVKLVPTSIR